MKPAFYLSPDGEDELVERANEILKRDHDLWPSKLVGELKVSYECAEHLIAQLEGRGLLKRNEQKLEKQRAKKKHISHGHSPDGNAGCISGLLWMLVVFAVVLLIAMRACAR